MSYQSGGGGISFSGDRITTAGLSSSGGSTYVPIGGSASAMPLPGSYPSAVEAERVNKYETSLPIRLDILAALAYILAPLSGLVLLIFETKNDYVRFHAWQAAISFSAILFAYLFLGLMSIVLVWIVGALHLGLKIWLIYNAYKNADSLERYELPIAGALASKWVDSE